MARKKPTKLTEPTESGTTLSRSEPADTDHERSVKPVLLDASRELHTIDSNHPYWSKPPTPRAKDPSVVGAIVRLRPPASATDEQVEAMRKLFAKAGAERVTVLPRPRAEVVPANAHDRACEKAIGARQAVLSLVEESNSKDKKALGGLCERVMAEVGL